MAHQIELDGSGVRAFLSLASQQKVVPRDVISMLGMPAYARMTDALALSKDEVRAAFLRGFDLEVGARHGQESPFAQLMAEDIRFSRAHVPELRALAHRAENEWNLSDAECLVRRFLPEACVTPRATISLVAGLAQGLQSGQDVIVDLPLAMILRPEAPLTNLTETVAHEVHHLWRQGCPSEPPLTIASSGSIHQVLTQLESEGIAMALVWDDAEPEEAIERDAKQMISFFGEPIRPMIDEWQAAYRGGHAQHLSRLEMAIGDELNSGSTTSSNRPILEILHSGLEHPVGHAMAHRIRSVLGHDALVSCVHRPLQFLRTYQSAVSGAHASKDYHAFDATWVHRVAAAFLSTRSP